MQILSVGLLVIKKRKILRTQLQINCNFARRLPINYLKKIDTTIQEYISDAWQQNLQNVGSGSVKETWAVTRTREM